MARSSKAPAGLVFLMVVIGGPVWLFQNHPVLAFVLLAAIIGGAILLARPRACSLCGVTLKRAVYEWQMDGVRQRVCPNCNRTLERRQSQRAIGAR